MVTTNSCEVVTPKKGFRIIHFIEAEHGQQRKQLGMMEVSVNKYGDVGKRLYQRLGHEQHSVYLNELVEIHAGKRVHNGNRRLIER